MRENLNDISAVCQRFVVVFFDIKKNDQENRYKVLPIRNSIIPLKELRRRFPFLDEWHWIVFICSETSLNIVSVNKKCK